MPHFVPKYLLFLLLIFFVGIHASAQPWVSRHGLSATDYKIEFDRWTTQGYTIF
ncbi:hypothetical protein [Solitalea lacus]|uniref:hypothetical protein n=1 Tax=Solitalea lacus TaxID=2911172 RepID=UPI003B84782F